MNSELKPRIFIEYKGALRRLLSEIAFAGAPRVSMREEDAVVAPGTWPAPLIRELLARLDPDPTRGGLVETPERVAKAWAEWTSGYAQNPADVLKVFDDGAENYDAMVIERGIPVYSHCEHHLAAIFGTATIAYIPDGRIVGLSKLSRLTNVFARRLQVQERLTNQIADALHEHLKPRGVGVVITARHMCMESRGINQQGHETITSALRGVIRDDPTARAEFLELRK